MSFILDMGYVTFKYASYPSQYDNIDQWAERGATFVFDSPHNIRMATHSFYKTNRGTSLPPVTIALKKKAKKLQEWTKQRHPKRCIELYGAEADDLLASICQEDPSNYKWVVSQDHDLLQIPNAMLIDLKMEPWGVERIKTKERLSQGSRYLAYQLITGCTTDTVPRSVLTRDRYTLPYVMSTDSPLRTAVELLPEGIVRRHLECLMLPSPLLTGEDAIEAASRLL